MDAEPAFKPDDRVTFDTGGRGVVLRSIRGVDGWTCLVSVPGVPGRTTVYAHESRLKLWVPS